MAVTAMVVVMVVVMASTGGAEGGGGGDNKGLMWQPASMCCPLLDKGLTQAYKFCASFFTPPPDCQAFSSRCYLDGRVYSDGEVVETHGGRCLKFVCVAPPPGTEGAQSATVKGVVVPSTSQCCTTTQQDVVPHGYHSEGNVHWCIRDACVDGKWHTQIDNQCCDVAGRVYFVGEVIKVWRDEVDGKCRQQKCTEGEKGTESSMPCCCIHGGQMVSCGSIISVSSTSCDMEVCDNGSIRRKTNLGCCLVDGSHYNHKQKVDGSGCDTRVCNNGKVIIAPDTCCRDRSGGLVEPGGVVELNAAKCDMKLCGDNATVVDASLEDHCACCAWGPRLYLMGDVVPASPCVDFVCTQNAWKATQKLDHEMCAGRKSRGRRKRSTPGIERPETPSTERVCVFSGGKDASVRTFLGLNSNFHGRCNYTLVQKVHDRLISPFIALQFTVCSDSFLNACCPIHVTIRHTPNLVITLSRDTVKVNGARVELPFYIPNQALMIWSEEGEIRVVTFNGFYVRYTRYDLLPELFVYAPGTELDRKWSGLCGDLGDPAALHDTPPTNSKAVLAKWNTGVSSFNPEGCHDDTIDNDPCCTDNQTTAFSQECGQLLKQYVCPERMERMCVQVLCACRQGARDICLLALKHQLELTCSFDPMSVLQGCEEQPKQKRSWGSHRRFSGQYKPSKQDLPWLLSHLP